MSQLMPFVRSTAIFAVLCWPTFLNATQILQLADIYQPGIEVKDYWISEKLDGIRARWNGSKLLTRNGNIIHAPDWFVQGFPRQALDGELWIGRNKFEQTASIVLREVPDNRWKQVKLMLFDLPEQPGTFSQRVAKMTTLVTQSHNPYLQMIPQFRLDNQQQLTDRLDKLVAEGAEGLMLHHQNAIYQNGRSNNLLKLKKYQDAEAMVIDQLPGKGKYSHMLGALLVELEDGTQFKIGTGFSVLQRQNPPPIGSVITFKYYGKTAKGLPRFASFMRVREE